MQSWILEESIQMPVHTDMRSVFDSLDGKHLEYNWLITNIEYIIGESRGPSNSAKWHNIKRTTHSNYSIIALDNDIVFLEGQELNEIIYGTEIQFIWAVFSGIKNDVIDISQLSVEPYANGNPNFWIPEPQIQHPRADIEIVCWDSSLTLFLTKDTLIGQKFSNKFIDARDLREYNKDF